MSQKIRSIGVFVLKAAVAAGILGWLFSRMDMNRVWSAVREARAPDVAVALGLMGLTLPVVGWRWQRLLRVYGVHLPVPVLMATVHVGQLFGLILPGSLGEDLIRTTSIARISGKRTNVVLTSVLSDRIAALLGLLFLALVSMPAHWNLLQTRSVQTSLLSLGMLGAALLAMAGIAVLVWVPVARLRGLVRPILERIPGRTRMEEWLTTLETLVAARGVFRSVLAGALVTQLLLCGVYYFCGKAVGVELPVLQWMGFVPIILAANVVPVTVAGIGVRDYLLVLFLSATASVDTAQAMAVSLLILAVSLTQCLSGVLSYLWFFPRLVAALSNSGGGLRAPSTGEPERSSAGAGIPRA